MSLFAVTFWLACCNNKNIEIIRILINITNDINHCNEYGITGLHWICFKNDYNTIKLLLENGADPFIKSTDGKTPFDFANEKGKDIISLFFE